MTALLSRTTAGPPSLRLVEDPLRPWRTLILAALAGVALFAIRLPFLSPVLANWDAAQFALGTVAYSVPNHQPHPPGYVLFVGLGALLNPLTGDANTSLALLAAGGAAIASVAFSFLAARFGLARPTVIVASAAFAASPLLWYYSTNALTYAPEAAFAAVVGLLTWRTIQSRDGRWLIAAAAVLGLAGGFRQTTEGLLLGLVLVAAWFARPRWTAAVAALVLVTVTAGWLVPLVILTGGLESYLQASAELGSIISAGSSIFSGYPTAVLVNLLLILVAAVLGLGVAAVGFLLPGPTPVLALRRGRSDPRVVFIAVWVAPATVVYALGHIGQPGYVLLMLPALILLAATGLDRLLRSESRAIAAAIGMAALVVAANAVIVAGGQPLLRWVIGAPGPLAAAIRDATFWQAPQFGLVDTRRDWNRIRQLAAPYAPGELLVLTGSDVLSNFRHAAYYLPQHRVIAVGAGDGGGVFFEAQGYRSTYGIRGYGTPAPSLAIPAQTRALLIIDNYLAEAFKAEPAPEPVPLGDGTVVHFVQLRGQPQSLFVDAAITLTQVPAFVERTTGDGDMGDQIARLALKRMLEPLDSENALTPLY